ncbi:hypothetical protein [Microtetraspora malaysiensis]|uniref:hypothetical protein n=1 Tax=Microtetraspora malaysiensis TaxID=161358 RepID=UPI003D8A4FC5
MTRTETPWGPWEPAPQSEVVAPPRGPALGGRACGLGAGPGRRQLGPRPYNAPAVLNELADYRPAATVRYSPGPPQQGTAVPIPDNVSR